LVFLRIMGHGCARLCSTVALFLLLGSAAPLRAQAAGQIDPSTAGTSATPAVGAESLPPAPSAVQPPAGLRVPSYDQVETLSPQPKVEATPQATTDSLRAWEGLEVESIEFAGVDRAKLEPLPGMLALKVHEPLQSENVRMSLRRLYATGLYTQIEIEGVRHGNQVSIIFRGSPALFLGRITVNGLKDDRLATRLQRATRLNPGTRFTDQKMSQADTLLSSTLQENGYYQGNFTKATTVDNADAQIDVRYSVDTGQQAKVGDVKVEGDPGMTTDQFRKKGKLKEGTKVTRDTVSRALTNLGKNYQKKQRLEAAVTLESKQFQPPVNRLNYAFQANQGPVVTINVNGVKLSKGKVKNLVPVYEEGSVDEDLLNEGNRRIRDYYQRAGYFDVQVSHQRTESSSATLIEYQVKLGERHEVESVTLSGNKYFSNEILAPRLVVHKANLFERHGSYSQALLQADVNTITALYQSNGFLKIKVTPDVKITDNPKVDRISVKYVVDEGVQERIGKYVITGEKQIPLETLTPLLNLESGQPYSAVNIIGDRDSILSHYFSHGFDHAEIAIQQQAEVSDPNLIDVTLNITEGDQIFVNRVLISGLHFTRPSTIDSHILVHPNQPLDQSALLEMQRQLYDLTLFNEVTAAVQNPGGDELRKNVLVQFTEARRWDISYGFGFQAQTGNPSSNCPNSTSSTQAKSTSNCGPSGNTGASGLVLFNLSRINLRGTDQSLTLRSQYGSLEQTATVVYNSPHIFNAPHIDFSLSGGYTNAQDVTTYAASTLQGTVRFTHRPNRANTLIYQFSYRRVRVDPNSVQLPPNEIPIVSEPVRVGGPGITWIRDTRTPSPLDASRGTYTSVGEFIADSRFGSEANFNRLDITNSSYYPIGKKGLIVARSTRFGYERSFGAPQYESIPLPERLYAGGAQSLRAYSINAAGPRDSQTGFPIGGAGAFVNSLELRFPNPTLPYFGDALGFVLFHDMGNVFNNSSDIWPSFIRTRQPHSATCKDLNPADQSAVTRSSSTNPTGICDFNYFTHAVGLGIRYHTPIGPIRLDLSVTPNPPIYPVIITYGTLPNGQPQPPFVGQAAKFNFFFSIGQAF
jgi:outer membrane protein insertion porin family